MKLNCFKKNTNVFTVFFFLMDSSAKEWKGQIKVQTKLYAAKQAMMRKTGSFSKQFLIDSKDDFVISTHLCEPKASNIRSTNFDLSPNKKTPN